MYEMQHPTQLFSPTHRTVICADDNGHGSWDHLIEADEVGREVEDRATDAKNPFLNTGKARETARERSPAQT